MKENKSEGKIMYKNSIVEIHAEVKKQLKIAVQFFSNLPALVESLSEWFCIYKYDDRKNNYASILLRFFFNENCSTKLCICRLIPSLLVYTHKTQTTGWSKYSGINKWYMICARVSTDKYAGGVMAWVKVC